ncbi:hypothetical protein T265_01636, partial [Opisthorchis viverrini]
WLPVERTTRYAMTRLQGLVAFQMHGFTGRPGSTRAGILSGCPSLDRGSRVAEVGFEPRTFRSVNSRS